MTEYTTMEIDLDEKTQRIMRDWVRAKYIDSLDPCSQSVFNDTPELEVALGSALINDMIVESLSEAIKDS